MTLFTNDENDVELANYFFIRFIQNMNINTNTPSPTYKAKISPQVEAQLYRQLRTCSQKKYQSNLLHQQLDNVRKWGDDNIEIVITQNSIGNFALGIKKIIAPFTSATWAIEHLAGKTELSQFLRLKESHIYNTENTIDYMYKKYGFDIFNNHKIYKKTSPKSYA